MHSCAQAGSLCRIMMLCSWKYLTFSVIVTHVVEVMHHVAGTYLISHLSSIKHLTLNTCCDALRCIISDVSWGHRVFWVFYNIRPTLTPVTQLGMISLQFASQQLLTMQSPSSAWATCGCCLHNCFQHLIMHLALLRQLDMLMLLGTNLVRPRAQ